MSNIDPKHIKEAKDYLDWKIKYIREEKKEENKKIGFFKRIMRKLFS